MIEDYVEDVAVFEGGGETGDTGEGFGVELFVDKEDWEEGGEVLRGVEDVRCAHPGFVRDGSVRMAVGEGYG